VVLKQLLVGSATCFKTYPHVVATWNVEKWEGQVVISWVARQERNGRKTSLMRLRMAGRAKVHLPHILLVVSLPLSPSTDSVAAQAITPSEVLLLAMSCSRPFPLPIFQVIDGRLGRLLSCWWKPAGYFNCVWSNAFGTASWGSILITAPDLHWSLSLQFQPPEAARVPVQRTSRRETNSCSHLWKWHYWSDVMFVEFSLYTCILLHGYTCTYCVYIIEYGHARARMRHSKSMT